jgi:hypothetical protein
MGKAVATVEQKYVKPPRISRLVRDACDLILCGEVKTIQGAAERLNCSREHLSRSLAKDHVQIYLQREAKRKVSAAVARAAVVKTDLLEAMSEHVRSQVASEILAIGGIQAPKEPTTTNVNVGVSVGYVIGLDSAPSASPTITVNATRDTDAT